MELLGGSVSDQALSLSTTGPDGAPHAALISAGEVLATDSRTVRLALWPTSSTTANLRACGLGLLTLALGGTFVGIHLETTDFGDIEVGDSRLSVILTRVTSVWEDRVPYAELTNGITFGLREVSVPERWALTTRRLREFVSPGPAQRNRPVQGHTAK
jgi:hypothetical protein